MSIKQSVAAAPIATELQLEKRAYQIIAEVIAHIRDIGITEQNRDIIDELALVMTDCFFSHSLSK